MVNTTAARFSLRQQKTTLANRPSVGQPLTTNPGRLQGAVQNAEVLSETRQCSKTLEDKHLLQSKRGVDRVPRLVGSYRTNGRGDVLNERLKLGTEAWVLS